MRLIKRLPVFVMAAALSMTAVACGGGGDDDDDGGQPPVDPTGTNTQYVVDRILMPTTAAQASMFGLNLDGDEQGRPDNALGQILSTLAGQAGGDFNLQESIDEQVADGSIILLANVKATALTTAAGVGTWIFLGENPSTPPCASDTDTTCRGHLNGSTSFDVSSASPPADDVLISGQIVGGKMTGGPGNVTIEISLVSGEDTGIVIDLVGARISVNSVSDTALTGGILGGAVTEEALDADIMPALHGILADTIGEDCTGTAAPCCEDGSTGQLLIDLFDESEPQDCMVTLEELKNNSLISSLLAPDVDLFDGDPSAGNFAPRKDGVKDALSLGIGFTAVPGTFTNPAGVD